MDASREPSSTHRLAPYPLPPQPRFVTRAFQRERVKLARAGEAQIIGICGEEGTGKSALLSRMIDAWVESGGLALVGRS